VTVRRIIFLLKGIPPLIYIVVNLCFWLILLIPLILLKIFIPLEKNQDAVSALMGWLYNLAVWCDDLLLFRIMGIKLDVKGIRKQYSKQFFIVIANHQSWNDVFILQHIFNRRSPILKFLVKRELIYLPIVGLVCWAYGYPFLRRHSAKGRKTDSGRPKRDSAVLEKALDRFLRYPATVINLVEGTRFSPHKAKDQKTPYDYLMKPKAGGLTTMLALLGDRIGAIVDVTIVYDCEHPTFWNLLCGECERVLVRVKEYSAEKMPPVKDYESVTTWISRVWEKKDMEIGALRQSLGRESGSKK
jgi:1-acyl-sn-glycerol-3-phosphate acyltransferase